MLCHAPHRSLSSVSSVARRFSRQCLSSDYSAREAYEMVPQLHARGDRVLQRIRKHVRETREKMDRAG